MAYKGTVIKATKIKVGRCGSRRCIEEKVNEIILT